MAHDGIFAKVTENLVWLRQLSDEIVGAGRGELELRRRSTEEQTPYDPSPEEDWTIEWKAGLDDERVKVGIVESLAGFANSAGGDLVLGRRDSGEVVGVDNAIAVNPKGRDGFKRQVLDLADGRSGALLAQLIRITFQVSADGPTICRVTVRPSRSPVWVRRDTVLPVRIDGKNQLLQGRQAMEYIRTHFSPG